MARITYGALVTNIRGSIGGTTFQTNAYGFTVKNRANMVKPNSASQQVSKLILAHVTKLWPTISQTGRDNWDIFAAAFPQYAKHNNTSILSGYAAFVKWHTAFYLSHGFNYGAELTPNTSPVAMDTSVASIFLVTGDVFLGNTWAIGDGSWLVNFFISRPFLASNNFIGSATRFVFRGSSTTGNQNMTAEFVAKYGSLPIVGQVLILGIQLYDATGGKAIATSFQRVTVT